jgi:prolyl 4-hydroxylase
MVDSTEPWVEVISWHPRAYYFHNFITNEEADHVIKLAKPYLKRSTVVGEGPDSSVVNNIRTSYGTFLQRYIDPVVKSLEDRVALYTRINVTHQEDAQILRYGHGQKYGAHMDVLEDGSPRVATILIYLTTPEEGGETAFPATKDSDWVSAEVKARIAKNPSECAKGHVYAPAKKGDALLFWSLYPDGHKRDALTLHTGCPVTRGLKYTFTKWIHTQPFRPEGFGVEYPLPPLPELCEDVHDQCGEWAEAGECEHNHGFMVGDTSGLGACRLACGECEKCEEEDVACKSRNRERSGYLPMEEMLSEG